MQRSAWKRLNAPWALVMAAWALCPGCDPGASGGPGGGRQQVESNDRSYVVTYETVPNPIRLNEPFTLLFDVRPRESSLSRPGELGVEVDARMPAHFHGMTRLPKFSRRKDGSYVAEGMLFHMPGRWEVYVDITQGPKVERAQWQVDLQ